MRLPQDPAVIGIEIGRRIFDLIELLDERDQDLDRVASSMQDKNRWPESGSSVKRSRTSAANPSIDPRKSVAPVAR